MPDLRPGAILPTDPLWAVGNVAPEPPKKKRKKAKRRPSKIDRAQGHLFFARLRRIENAEKKWRAHGHELELRRQVLITDMFNGGATHQQMMRYFKVSYSTVQRWRRAMLGRDTWPRLVLFETNRAYNDLKAAATDES